LTLVLITLGVSACDQLPPFPTVEVKLVDNRNGKIHRYNLPKERGVKAPYLGSVPASLGAVDKHYCYAAAEHSKLELYISKVEDIAQKRCN
jgi:hypothetical protein